jgi:hypothetical protein
MCLDLTYDGRSQIFLTGSLHMVEPKRNARTRSAVLDDAETISDAAEDCRQQGFIHSINRLEAIAVELDTIAAELRATEFI